MTCLAHIIRFTVVLCIYFIYTNARYLNLDRGKLGKEYWGQNHTVMEGDNITLHCGSQIMSNHSNFKSRRWFWLLKERKLGNKDLPDQPLMESYFGPTPRRHRPTGFVTWPEHVPPMDMKVVKVNRYSTGRYACAVASLLGTTTYSEITLQNVFVKCKPRIEAEKETEIQVNAGDKLALDCTSSGYPTPVVTWHRVDGRPLQSGYIKHRGLLFLKKVDQLDRGKYQCISSNMYGNDTRIFSVNITVKPRIIGTTISYAKKGQEGMVKCVAVGIPRPIFSWGWLENGYEETLSTRDGVMGRFKVKTVHYFENSTSYLIIDNVRLVDFRHYECFLKDSADNTITKKTKPLKEYSVPDAPAIRRVSTGSTSITLSCQLGESNGGKPVTSVIIEIQQPNGTLRRETIEDVQNPVRHSISGLKSYTEYKLRAIAVNDMGESKPSTDSWIVTKRKENFPSRRVPVINQYENKDNEPVDMMIMVAGVAGGFLVLIIAIVIVCILMRNMQRNSAKKAAENAERLAKSANDDTTTALINFLQHGGDRLSTTTGSGGGDILHLTTSNKWEFPRERLVLQNVLGSGAFGIVMRAEAEGINGYNSGTTPVAVKFVKENESASAKKDLIAELELLKLIEPHKNVINLLGCCTRSEPLMVIVEFCAYGDLQSFLRASRGIRDQYYLDCYKRPSSRLTSKELLMFGTQISRGMAHLACLKVIHRDLAARNILVDENKVCKVSDFGFARDIYVEDHYTRKTAGGRFPIKWMAIESLLDGISTTKSDVWSFAIVLWEIITLGASPYPGMNSQEVVSFLQNGMRMDKPKHCSDELYNLLLDCWQVASHRRPNFEMLARYLDRMCNDDFEYINMRTYDDHLYINFDGNTVSEGSKSGSLLKQDTDSKENSEESTGDKESY